MQYRPTAAELLEAIADLLGDEVIDAVPDSTKHRVRVAHNLTQILEREHRLGDELARHEATLLRTVLDDEQHQQCGAGGDISGDAAVTAGELQELRGELSHRLRTTDDPDFERAAWHALVAVASDDLAIAKPGHDIWEGQ